MGVNKIKIKRLFGESSISNLAFKEENPNPYTFTGSCCFLVYLHQNYLFYVSSS